MAFTPLIAIPVQLQDSVTSLNMSGGTLEFYLSGTSTPTNLYSNNTGTSKGSSITLNSGGFPESGGNVITLFRDSSVAIKIVGKNAAGTTIFTSDGLEDALVVLASTSNAKGASLIGVEDSGGHYSGANVEAALADIGENALRDDRDQSINATFTFTGGGLDMVGQAIDSPLLQDFRIKHSVVTSTAGGVTLDMSTGNSFEITLTENITTITLSNPPASGVYGQLTLEIIQDGGGGAYTVAFPAAVTWPGGTAPTITTSNDAVDTVALSTRDNGTTWRGNFSQAYA